MARHPENTGGRGDLGRLFAALVDSVAETVAPAREAAVDFNVDRLGRRLASAKDPMGLLASLAAQAMDAEGASALELRLAERLDEAGIFADDVELPEVRVVRPRTSGLFYLRIDDQQIPYLAKLRVLGIEAALNSALLCSALLEDGASATREDLVKLEQRVARSIAGQGAEPLAELEGEPTRGEWHDRHAIAAGIECLRLPYRLTARFRVNAAAGRAAIECDLVPPRLMPKDAYVDGIGVVPATEAMRRRAATDYNLRLVVLLAAYVFAATEDIGSVHVAGVVDTAARHACYVSARIEREDLEGIDLARLEPASLLRFLCASLDERDGELAPVAQGFSLDEPRFCPRERFARPELSDAKLSPAAAAALGCARLSGLSCEESALRAEAGRAAAAALGPTTESSVRAVLEVGRSFGDADVEEASRRVARALIDGELDEGDPEAVAETFASQGELARAADRATSQLLRGEVDAAAVGLAQALAPIEAQGLYRDGAGVSWRVFDDYVDRVLYNRLFSQAGREVRLAPRAYLEALSTLSLADLLLGRAEAALGLARQAAHLAPLSTQAALNYSHCLEQAGDLEGAVAECSRILECADDPQGIGFCYVNMAQLQFKAGHVNSSQACYQLAAKVLPPGIIDATRQIAALLGATPQESLSDERALQALRDEGIPIAPTEEVSEVLYEAAVAATDENLFRVARECAYLLVSLTRDDIYHGVLRSLEGEPDY